MGRLHERDEPLPYTVSPQSQKLLQLIGPHADELLALLFKRHPDFGVIKCDYCGRWEDFDPPHTFASMRERAKLAGWRRVGQDDACRLCVGN